MPGPFRHASSSAQVKFGLRFDKMLRLSEGEQSRSPQRVFGGREASNRSFDLNEGWQDMIDPRDRQKALAAIRNLKMARSAHATVGGSTERFYQWLESGTRCNLPDGPPIWICGDCHLGNLGPLADTKGRVLVQIRDLDQTVIGNPAHDLVRLGLSLASAARSSDRPGVATARVLEELIAGYQSSLEGDFSDQKERDHRPKII